MRKHTEISEREIDRIMLEHGFDCVYEEVNGDDAVKDYETTWKYGTLTLSVNFNVDPHARGFASALCEIANRNDLSEIWNSIIGAASSVMGFILEEEE